MMGDRRAFYAEIEPYAVHALAVGDGHTLHVEEAGNPQGLPVVFLHGGPGSGCSPSHRRYFDPQRYRAVLFDQRGAGRSQPTGELTANTTAHLIEDMERIRRHLQIERWLVFGGSWGATLALLYAQAHPQHTAGLVLRGSFLARREDLEWFVSPLGVRRIFPDRWPDFADTVPAGEGDIIARAAAMIRDGSAAERAAVALGWEAYTSAVVTQSLPDEAVERSAEAPTAEGRARAVAGASIELTYAANGFFIEENQILQRMASIAHLPAIIIHGRRDLTCTADSAFALAAAMPDASLEIVRDAGHLGIEAGIIDALVRAADAMADRLTEL
ncbi:MAG: prolyl aminopeptidase [Pseudomonadota bacterium]